MPFIGGLEQADTSSICNSSKNRDSNQVQDIGTNLHQSDNPFKELHVDPMLFSFTHLENLSSSSTSGMSFYGESFFKSPIRNSQVCSTDHKLSKWIVNCRSLVICSNLIHH